MDFHCGAGGAERLLFLHANGYTPRAYRQMLEALVKLEVHAPGLRPLQRGGRPTRHWGDLARDLGDWVDDTLEQPIAAAGHSLGAVVLLLAAAQRPSRFRSLVLIEPVSLPPWATWLLRYAPARIRARSPMAEAARRRSSHWESRQAAFAHERGRKAHARIDDSVLKDVLADGLSRTPAGTFTRSYASEWEAQLFESPPNIRPALRSKLPPVTVVRGGRSTMFSQRHCEAWRRRRPQDRIVEIPGAGHLVPLEMPRETAAALQASFRPIGGTR